MVDRRSPQQAPTRELLSYFDALHLDHLGERAVINGGKDAKLLAGLCHSHGPERVKELMGLFFASDDEFIQQAGYTVGVFMSQAGKLIARQRKAQKPSGIDAALDVLRGTGTHGPTGIRRAATTEGPGAAQQSYPREVGRGTLSRLGRGHGGLLD